MEQDEIDVGSGRVLLASGAMQDPGFARAVILLCEHNDEGSFGLVLNRPLGARLADGFPELRSWDAPLFKGGPVEAESLHFIHTCADIDVGSREILPGLFWGGSFEAVDHLVCTGEADPDQFRFFAGYAGWSSGQLDTELERMDWYVADAELNQVFHEDPETHWRSVLRGMGTRYAVYANMPSNPQLN